MDNIRPIALTSNLVKLVERIIYAQINRFIDKRSILSPCQIEFRAGCSIWNAHADLESHIELARRDNTHAPLVTLDIAKAYDTVEHGILMDRLESLNFTAYIETWIHKFFLDRKFYSFKGCFSSTMHTQTRGVPQGSVLSLVLSNEHHST